MYPGVGTFVLIRPTQTFYERIKVATRVTIQATHSGDFQGVPPTGKEVTTTGIVIMRIADGKIAEEWVEFDAMGMMQHRRHANSGRSHRIAYRLGPSPALKSLLG